MKNITEHQDNCPMLYILDPSKDITGAFIAAKNEAKLIQKDFNVVLVLPSVSKISDEDLTNFSKVLRLPIYDIRKSLSSILLYFPMLIISGWQLKQAMKRDHCKVLQVNDYYLMQGVVARLFGFKGKIVTWVRIDHRRYGSFFSKYWLKFDYWASDAVVAVSNFILSTLPESDKNILIYDPIVDDVPRFCENKKSDKKKIVYIGNYMEGKGQQHAIRVFISIAEKFPEAELHFYGGDLGLKKNKRFKAKLEKQAKEAFFTDRIYFHGFVKKTASVLHDAYMALNFSESESFSMTCLEASAAGVSVIATRSGGPEEIVVDGKTGYLVKKGDIEAMAEAMKKLLTDSVKNEIFGKSGILYVRQKFSFVSFGQNINELFSGDKK